MASPKDYSAFSTVQRYRISAIIEEFADNLVKISGKCIDIGCGPGDTTKEFLLPSINSNGEIIGIDISENMIKYANDKFKDEKRLQFDTLNIETKNLPKKYISQFNHIFSFHTLQWCNDIRQVFENIYQMLQPDGTILLNIVTFNNAYEVLRILARNTRFASYVPETMKNISPYHESKNPLKELKELLKSIGFTIHHCSLREGSYGNKKSEQFVNSILSILTFLDNMPNVLRNDFKNIFRHEYMRRLINYKSIHNNEEHTLDLYKELIIYAQKII
ncbi:PREDICTED: juvenile hormone acid O-methyltransferase-like [Trachymyrmex septentrionalis]|uniref:juvenile hormone acid O-methyltransferase-like n=1 Tax=Trachymyrmex septentrionalis TaxID=34720 RepID=UPI00084ED6B1|nr:PREDICTED: juvenile hormone acid O-methyltransferase-like [Trachymyrmex septentrionalis]